MSRTSLKNSSHSLRNAMGQIVRDIGMTLLVALVIHALYAARHTRPAPAAVAERIYAAASQPVAAAIAAAEHPPAGFSVFPWAP